ncbi:MAG TPA: oligosaccharide flippase family protein [Bryobacteraceae bacterium]|nr:oligosaccharide flippase family protein [Bryobacteraceae bacterium]
MNRRFWENLISLYGVHIASYVIPLFTLPYVARVLQPAEWGSLAFAEAYSIYMTLVVEFGFGLSATREVARVRDDVQARARALSGVLGAQMLLAVAAVILTAGLARTLPIFATRGRLIPGALLLGLSRAANPMWYFQGIERMRLMSILNIATSAAAAAGIFTLVKSPGDGGLLLVLRGSAACLATVIGFLIAFRKTPFLRPSMRRSWEALRQGGSLFLFKGSVTFYTTANVLILGVLTTPATVAWYAGAEKIAKAAVSGIWPMVQAFYPRINHLFASDRERAAATLRASAWLIMGVGLAAGVTLFAGAPILARVLLGRGFELSIPVLRVLALLPPMLAASHLFGIQWMLPLRMDREFNRITIMAGLLNVGLALILARRYGAMGMAVSVACAETFVTLSTVVALRRRGLDPWRPVKATRTPQGIPDVLDETVAGARL